MVRPRAASCCVATASIADANAAVVVPQYGAPNDRAALAAIQDLFPERKAIGLRADHVLTGGGSFHCISQQVPT